MTREIGCACGRPDWPGSCPGPANCPCVDSRPRCVSCDEPTRDVQEGNGDWWCQDCHDDAAQQQAEDTVAEPPQTMAEMHRAAWAVKQETRR